MRCKACDNILEDKEIVWYEERQEHEEFCSSCKLDLLKILDDYSADIEIDYDILFKEK
mgnify:CR=1 FL=1